MADEAGLLQDGLAVWQNDEVADASHLLPRGKLRVGFGVCLERAPQEREIYIR